jgi:hypothetical protein
MWLMNPALPDHETIASNIGLAPRGRAWVMINEEWPKIKADLDSGILSPIGLATIKSLDPFQMGHNHQVLAYGYELDCAGVVIRIYDPNYPDDDHVTLSLILTDPQHPTSVTHSKGDPVLCFFRPAYTFPIPPPPINLIGSIGNEATKIAVAPFADGRLDVYMVGLDGNMWHNSQPPGGAWTGFQMVGTPGNKAIDIAVARRPDGNADVVMVNLNKNMIWMLAHIGP